MTYLPDPSAPSDRYSDTAALSSAEERYEPIFQRVAGNPFFSLANQNMASGKTASPSVYWPYVIKTQNSGAIDNYYMYYSTDHSQAAGGIFVASGPTNRGPWTGQGVVYTDTTGGIQTETPGVIWNDDTSLYHLFYHQEGAVGAVGSDTSCVATSPDGLTWTKVGIAIDVQKSTSYTGSAAEWPGDGHTGYFRPFRLGRRWFAYHLLGGGNYPGFGLSQSQDGLHFTLYPQRLGYGIDNSPDGRRIEWNSGDVVLWRGRLWWIGEMSNFTSGSTPKDARIVSAQLAGNLRGLIGTPRVQLYPTVGAETTNYRALQVHANAFGGLDLIYQTDTIFNLAATI